MNFSERFKHLFLRKPASKRRVLFILKERQGYDDYSYGVSSGLYNSAKFCSDMLGANGYDTKLVEVVDNNSIDHEVAVFRPEIVIIEALWVVPSKFEVLQQLHPHVTWIVRVHSEAPFLAQEGIGVEWVVDYAFYKNVYVAANSQEAVAQITAIYRDHGDPLSKLLYLPTYYPAPSKPYFPGHNVDKVVNICCMGAIRPLKNTLIQAIAAMAWADSKGLILRFHINDCRLESGGGACYRNVVSLFAGTKHQLVQHDWLTHAQFLKFLSGMDISMQVSFSETFCIVAADSVASGVATVGSPAITWLDSESKANTIVVEDIVRKLNSAYGGGFLSKGAAWLKNVNLDNLRNHANQSRKAWLKTIAGIPGA